MYLRALSLVLFVFLVTRVATTQAQANPDQFPNLDQYNSASRQLRETGQWRWYYEIATGCGGGLKAGIQAALDNISAEFGVVFIETNSGWRMRASCGTDISVSCGTNSSVIACLGEGYPFNVNIKFRDTMATFEFVSQVSIVLHEMFHGMATWNEQYGYANGVYFSNGTLDVMDIGSGSRHYIGPIERARWDRTMNPSLIKEAFLDLEAGVIWHSGSNDRALRTAVFTQQISWPEWGPFEWTGLSGCLAGVLASQCWASPIPGNLPPCTAVYVAPENGLPSSWAGFHPEKATFAGATPC